MVLLLKLGKLIISNFPLPMPFFFIPPKSFASGSELHWCLSPKQWLSVIEISRKFPFHEVELNFVHPLFYLRTPAFTGKGNISNFLLHHERFFSLLHDWLAIPFYTGDNGSLLRTFHPIKTGH